MKKTTKLTTRLHRQTKAVSKIISVLLMIAIAIAAALIAYAWLMGYLGQTTHKTELAIQIQSVTSINENGHDWLMFYVQNVGQGIVHLQQDSSVYINDFLRTISYCPKNNPLNTGEILPIQIGETKELKMDCYYQQGDYLKIKVVTTEGTFAELTIQGTNTNEAPLPPGTITHTLTLRTLGNGVIYKNPNKSLYKHAEVVQLLASTYPGWQFTQWSGDATGNTNPTTIAMLSDKTITATFTQKEYTLVIHTNGEGTITQTPPGPTYHLGDTVTLTATPAQNWYFAGWTGDITSHDLQTTVTIDETPEVTATFTLETYSLTTTTNPPNGGTITRSADKPYTQGQTVTLTANPATGYTFSGWSGDATGSTNPASVTITGNMIVTANFEQNAVTLTLNANPPAGGTIAPNIYGPYKYGDQVQLTAITNTGYTFSGWTGDLSGIANPTWITLNGNKAVTATFTQKEYTLHVYTDGSGTVTKNPDKTTYHYGDQVTLTATPAQNWYFAGWTGDVTSHDLQITLTIDETPEVTATFTQDQYSLTLTSNPANGGSTDMNPPGPTYAYNTVVTLTPRPNDGFMFTGFTGDLVSSTGPAQITITKNMAVTSQFERMPVTLTLNVNPAGAGTITPSPPDPYYYGDTVQLTAAPAAGYSFSQWSGDLTGTTNPSTITLDDDKTMTATFTQKEYTLTITQIGQGTITKSPDKTTYHLNEQVTLTATPAQGWNFAGWTGDVTSSSTQITLTIDETPAVTATFTQATYSLTVSSSPTQGGTVSQNPPGSTYTYGQLVTLTANPSTGYTFTGWSGAITGTVSPATITITGNMLVTANFARIGVTLTLNVSPAGKGSITVSPPGPYYYGDTVQLTATPIAGYSFSQWSGDLTGSTNPATLTLNGDKTVTAAFTQNPTQVLISIGFDGTPWDAGWNFWSNPPWARATDQYSTSPASAKCTRDNQGPFSSDPLNAQGATAIVVTFDYRVQGTSASDFKLYYSGDPYSDYNRVQWTDLGVNLGGASAGWHTYTITITNPNAFTSTFRFQFRSQNLGSGDAIWVDNVQIVMRI